jgi:hypothetical protein
MLSSKGEYFSNTAILGHKIAHATEWLINPDTMSKNAVEGTDSQYDTKEERRVIAGIEKDYAKFAQEGTRDDHKGILIPSGQPPAFSSMTR